MTKKPNTRLGRSTAGFAADDPSAFRVLRAEDLARFLDCSVSHIYELASCCRIPSLKIGRLVRFELDAVLQALRENGEGN